MLEIMVGLIYELGTFYIVFIMYLLFFGVSVKISRRQFLAITGYAVAIILLGLVLGFSVVDVPVIMLITSLIFSKRKMINRLVFKISNQFAERKREKKKAEYKDIIDSLKS